MQIQSQKQTSSYKQTTQQTEKLVSSSKDTTTTKRAKQKEITQIVYEQEDQHSADVFKKYLFLAKDQSKTGQSIRNYIEMSDYYLQNFHATRDSEFSEYDDLDLTDIKEASKAEIEAIRGGKSKNIDIFQIKRKNKQGTAFKLEKYDKVSDLATDQTDDEEKLIAHFLKKRDEKSKLAEYLRDKQSRMLELNDQIRKYDINQVRTDELDQLNSQMLELNLRWGNLKTSLEEKLRFAEKMHKKHHDEVEEYEQFSDNLDRGKFNQKVKRITFELHTEQKDFAKTSEQMLQERDKLAIYIERARRDFEDERLKSDGLQRQLLDIDGSQNQTNTRMREQIHKMKTEMDRINNYSIDISNDPASAIQRISDPILDLMNVKIDDYQEQLKENLANKKRVQQDLIEIKNSLFEEKVNQINLKRKREEIDEEFKTLREDIETVQLQMLENMKRKTKVAEQIEQSTQKFQEEAKELREELSKYQQRLITIFQHKEIVEDQAQYLQNDRGGVGAPQKYKESITEFVTLAKGLKIKYDAIQDRILKLDNELALDPLYTKGQGKTAKVLPIQEFYKCGKYEEREKKDTLMKDLEKKHEHILDLIVTKESLEETLAPFGNIHHIYKTFKEVQEDIKSDIRRYLREKHQIFLYLNSLVNDFEKNRETIGLQEGNLKTHLARFKAVYYLLQEKLLRIRILEDELLKLKKVVIQSIGNQSEQLSMRSGFSLNIDPSGLSSEEQVIANERELVMRMTQDRNQKDQEINSLKQLLNERDQEIGKYQQLMDEKGYQESQEEILIEEKMKNILALNEVKLSEIIKIAKNAYKIGQKCFVYLKLAPIQERKNAYEGVQRKTQSEILMREEGGQTERILLAKVSLKGHDGLKKCREHRLEGSEVYYEFEQIVRNVFNNLE